MNLLSCLHVPAAQPSPAGKPSQSASQPARPTSQAGRPERRAPNSALPSAAGANRKEIPGKPRQAWSSATELCRLQKLKPSLRTKSQWQFFSPSGS